MKFDLDENLENFLKIIVKCAKNNDSNIYFVGGVVRDNLLGISLNDIDLITDSNALEFINFLPDKIIIKSIHKDFYTAKLEYKCLNIDIASTRVESYPYSGCLPVVNQVGVNIKQDYLRRDFTINSLYLKLDLSDSKLTFELIDYASGVEDIKNKTLRVLHDKSYIDDPTRILRGVEFKHRFNFDFSMHDKELIKEYFKNYNTEMASIDRFISVFKHIFSSKNADKVFKDVVLNKYYKLINHQDLQIDFNFINDIIQKFHILDKSDFYFQIIQNQEVEQIKVSDIIDIKQKFSKLKINELAYYYYKTRDFNAVKYFKIKDINLFAKGLDIISLGVSEGKAIGSILNNLLHEKLTNPHLFKNKADEINWIKNFINNI